MAKPRIDLTGQKYSRLTVIRPEKEMKVSAFWICECECGNMKRVFGSNLRNGNVQSCGCINTKHGASRTGAKHPLYRIWTDMISRCHNKNHQRYPYYGAKGISVCEIWQESYPSFRDHMLSLPNCPLDAQKPNAKLGIEIDRIKGREGYKPGNVRWATHKEQMNNTSKNTYIRVNGTQMTLANAIDAYAKVTARQVMNRLRDGWPLKDAFLTPLRAYRMT
jgi:hypothetical protein